MKQRFACQFAFVLSLALGLFMASAPCLSPAAEKGAPPKDLPVPPPPAAADAAPAKAPATGPDVSAAKAAAAATSQEIEAIVKDATMATPAHPLLGKPNAPGGAIDLDAIAREAEASQTQSAVQTKDSILIATLGGVTLFADPRTTDEDVLNDTNTPSDLKSGIDIRNLKTPEPEALKKVLQDKFINKPLTFNDLNEIVKAIIAHYSKYDRPMTHVYIPEQAITDKVKIAVIEARFGKAMPSDKDRPHKWYRTDKILNSFSVAVAHNLGDDVNAPMDKKSVDDALEAFNLSPWSRLGHRYEHPFRRVNGIYAAGENLGQTDLKLDVIERSPINLSFNYENSGTTIIGEHRFTLGAVFYNVWNKDHQLGLQAMSGIDTDAFRGGVVSYQVPFKKWHQSLEFFGAYVDSNIQLPSGGADATQDLTGTSWQLGLRHHIGLPRLFGPSDSALRLEKNSDRLWAYYHEITLGLDYKVSNNDLAFGGTQVFAAKTDVAQFSIGYAARQTDPYGESTLHLDAFWSPGGLTSNNSDETFEKSRELAKANYFYGKLQIERVVDLPAKMMLQVRLNGQYASENLLASEELGLGGFDTVRGYPERVARGDTGFYTQWELYSPPMHLFSGRAKKAATKYNARHGGTNWESGQDELRFLLFFDYGITSPVNDTRNDFGNTTLMSMGVGLRYRFNSNIVFRADYGFQLEELTGFVKAQAASAGRDDLSVDSNGHAHLGMTVNF